jgi:type III pantothenate kinase
MNLVIDSGNTLVKVAVFDQNREIVEQWSGTVPPQELFKTLLEKFKCTHAIISDVSGQCSDLLFWLEKKLKVIQMSPDTPTPLKISYQSRATLGTDRIAAAVYSVDLFPQYHTLTIQAGTCITFEFANDKKEYIGGSISPGLDLRFQALHNFTARLPLVHKEKINFLIGTTTKESVLSGVINGCIAETDGIIDQYKSKYPDIQVIMGGGDIIFFDKQLKNRIFATANLVLKGLNIILEHNK